MSRPKREQHYVDVIERVLGGVQVTTGNERTSRAVTFDLHSRGWFGVRKSSVVEVSYAPDEDWPTRHDE